ncbi:hypothetical protein RSAG8_07164, partial [Rhizoctonia solani AG-8 WAC10335]
MTHHTRKRARVPLLNDNASIITSHSATSEESVHQDNPSKIFNTFTRSHRDLRSKFYHIFTSSSCKGLPLPENVAESFLGYAIWFHTALDTYPQLKMHPHFDSAADALQKTYQLIRPDITKADASTSAELAIESPKPTYASVAAQADAPTPSLPAQPQGLSPSPTRTATAG